MNTPHPIFDALRSAARQPWSHHHGIAGFAVTPAGLRVYAHSPEAADTVPDRIGAVAIEKRICLNIRREHAASP